MNRFLFTILILQLQFCSSVRNYLYDRTRDASDIIHIGLEKDIYGASIFVDSFGLGIQHAANGKGIGMRYGTVRFYKTVGKYFILNTIKSESLNHSCILKKSVLMNLAFSIKQNMLMVILIYFTTVIIINLLQLPIEIKRSQFHSQSILVLRMVREEA